MREVAVHDWASLMALREQFDEAWIFRGQPSSWPLETSLERACALFDVPGPAVPAVEAQIVQEFRRRYTGRQRRLLFTDTLYCMALMQHHGAPTRLLDFTYSFHVATYFALEPFGAAPTLWCLNGKWFREQAARLAGEELIRTRERDRNERTFRELYMAVPPHRFVFPENPFPLHRRLIIQQGVFACPADITVPFLANLNAQGPHAADAVVKLNLAFDEDAKRAALAELLEMNVDRATLFPGLDGFAQSLRVRIPLYQRVAAAWAKERSDEQDPDAPSDPG
jgi:hypothetical protein